MTQKNAQCSSYNLYSSTRIISILHADMLTVVSEPSDMGRRRGTYVPPFWEMAGHGEHRKGREEPYVVKKGKLSS